VIAILSGLAFSSGLVALTWLGLILTFDVGFGVKS
jgi:hypothetical protein